MKQRSRRLSWVLVTGVVFAMTATAAGIDEGIQLYKQADYQQAERVLREFLGENPDSTQGDYYLGLTLFELKKYGDAGVYLGKAISEPGAKVALGKTYTMADKLDDAMRTLDEAAKESPDNAEVYQYRGMILLKRNQFDEAAKQLAKAVELDPKNAYAHYYYGLANSRLKRPDLMVKHFQLFLQLAPDAPEAAKVRSLLKSL